MAEEPPKSSFPGNLEEEDDVLVLGPVVWETRAGSSLVSEVYGETRLLPAVLAVLAASAKSKTPGWSHRRHISTQQSVTQPPAGHPHYSHHRRERAGEKGDDSFLRNGVK